MLLLNLIRLRTEDQGPLATRNKSLRAAGRPRSIALGPETPNPYLVAPVVDPGDLLRRRDQLQEVDLLRFAAPLGGLGEVDRHREALLGGQSVDRRHAVVEAELVLQRSAT